MFKRLLKHHLKSTWKEFNISFAVIIILGLFLTLSIKSKSSMLIILSSITFTFSLIALIVLLISFIIKLFYSTTYGKQGYLTFTLPISTHALIISKIVAALLYSIGLAVSIFISILMSILLIDPEVLKETSPIFIDIIKIAEITPGTVILFTFYGIVTTLSSYVTIQLACALANTSTSSKSKVGIVILILWGLNVACSTIVAFQPFNLYFLLDFETGKLTLGPLTNDNILEGVLSVWELLVEVGKMVGFYFLTVYVIDKKIEIQ